MYTLMRSAMAFYRSLRGRPMAINPICMPHVRNSMLANTHTQSLHIRQMEALKRAAMRSRCCSKNYLIRMELTSKSFLQAPNKKAIVAAQQAQAK